MSKISTFTFILVSFSFFWTFSFGQSSGRPIKITNLGSWDDQNPILMTNSPGGSGTTFNNCYLASSHTPVTDNISVLIEYDDEYGGVVDGSIFQNTYWKLELERSAGGDSLFSCSGWVGGTKLEIYHPFNESLGNPSQGIYIIDAALLMGGGGELIGRLYYRGILRHYFGPMQNISYDINGDGSVNLADVQLFASISSGGYSQAIDYYYDGVINLSDLPILSSHYGESCP